MQTNPSLVLAARLEQFRLASLLFFADMVHRQVELVRFDHLLALYVGGSSWRWAGILWCALLRLRMGWHANAIVG